MAIRRAINLLWALVTDHRHLVQPVSYAMRGSTATSAVARAGGAKWLSPRTARRSSLGAGSATEYPDHTDQQTVLSVSSVAKYDVIRLGGPVWCGIGHGIPGPHESANSVICVVCG
jgi:hypothetical protein